MLREVNDIIRTNPVAMTSKSVLGSKSQAWCRRGKSLGGQK